jgi:KRAB domain-containing zinc finger protein
MELCPICGKEIKNSLKGRMKTHGEERPFACPECPKAFLLPRTPKDHVLAAHRNERPFVCSECEKASKWKKN